MPGVPSSVACDGCRKLKKRCDLTKPSCSRCTQRGIPCIGNGVKRWKFMTPSQPNSQTALAWPRPRRCPSNETTRIASAFFHLLCQGEIKWNCPTMGGDFMMEVLRRIGTSRVLDASISAFVASFKAVCPYGNREKALVLYGDALGALRVAMQDPTQSIATKIYSILLVSRCQDYIDPGNRLSAPNTEMTISLLRNALHRGKVSEIGPQYIYPICQAVAWEAWVNPRVELLDWFWEVLDFASGPRPHAYQHQQPFLSLDAETQAEAALYFRDPERNLDQILRIYNMTMAEKPKLRLRIEQMLAAETIPAENEDVRRSRLTSRVLLQFYYGMMIFLASKLNRAMQRLYLVCDPGPLSNAMHELCDDAIWISASSANLRPFGSFVAPKALVVAWACLPEADDYRREELEEWMVYFQSPLEGADYVKEAKWTRKRLDMVSAGPNQNLDP